MSIQPKWFSLFWFTLSLYLYLQLMVMKASSAALVIDCTLSSCWRFVATIKRWSHFWFCLFVAAEDLSKWVVLINDWVTVYGSRRLCRLNIQPSVEYTACERCYRLSTAAVVSVSWIYVGDACRVSLSTSFSLKKTALSNDWHWRRTVELTLWRDASLRSIDFLFHTRKRKWCSVTVLYVVRRSDITA